MIIYLVTNKITGRLYVGLTRATLKQRWSEHVSLAIRQPDRNCLLHRAIRAYGQDSFTLEILAILSNRKEANLAERFYIAILGTYPPERGIGYNLTPGGDGKIEGTKWSESQRRKMSAIMRGRFIGQKNPMYGKGLYGSQNGMYGHRFTQEERKQRSEACQGIHAGPQNPFWGKKHSDELKRHWSLSRRGSGNPSFGKDRTEVAKKGWITRRIKSERNPQC